MIALTPNLYDYIYSQREQEMWVSVEKVFVCRFDLWREWAAQSLSTALWGLGNNLQRDGWGDKADPGKGG